MRHLINKFAALTLATTALLAATGCSSMKQGPMTAVTPVTPVEQQRVGSVYLLRGFIGIFSTGIDNLGTRISEQGVHAQVFQETQWSQLADEIVAKYKDQPNHEPIVLIGHSYGADGVVKIARKLREGGVKVELVVTLDPVTPPKVPNNVGLVYNLYQSSALDNLPFLRGIPLKPEDDAQAVALKNMNIRKDRTDLLESGLDHFNIEKKKKVQDDVIAQVLKVCEPRQQWAMARASRTIAVATAKPANPARSAVAVATPTVTPVVSTPVVATPSEPAAQLASATLPPDAEPAKNAPAPATQPVANVETLTKVSAE